jgi:hypothetical protein
VNVALCGLVVVGLAGCPGINDAPALSITGLTRVYPKQTVKFEATVRDKSKGTPTIEWVVGETCPDTLELALRGNPLATGTTFAFTGDDVDGRRCVWALASDSEGARVFATHAFTVKRRDLVVRAPAMVVSGKDVSYSADYADEPAAVAGSTFFWGEAPMGEAADPCKAAREKATSLKDAARDVPSTAPAVGNATWKQPARRQAFCVVVQAKDEFKFDDLEAVRVIDASAITNGGPPASIRVVAPAGEMPFGIFSNVHLGAGAEGDLGPQDKITFAWKLTAPGGGSSVPAPCESVQPANAEVCFQVAATGDYQVELTVTEGAQTASATPFKLQVQDRPPCIRATEPNYLEAARSFPLYDRDQVFRVNEIDDDGDPLPPPDRVSEQAFVWSVRRKGDDPRLFRRLVNATFRNFVIPAREFQPGDEVEVRVEYRDRLDLKTPRPSHCMEDDPLCEAKAGSGCTQRVTWTVVYL